MKELALMLTDTARAEFVAGSVFSVPKSTSATRPCRQTAHPILFFNKKLRLYNLEEGCGMTLQCFMFAVWAWFVALSETVIEIQEIRVYTYLPQNIKIKVKTLSNISIKNPSHISCTAYKP
jgi:hypothetical protein